jgi:hypothetical protein
MNEQQARIAVRWLKPMSNEQFAALPGSRQGLTARFQDDPASPLFSVILTFDQDQPDDRTGPFGAWFAVMFPDRLPELVGRVRAGVHVWICHGPNPVADGEVTSVASPPLHGDSPAAVTRKAV